MKRIAVLLLLLLLPLCLVSMNPLSDPDMANISGQSGVTINIDATMNVSFAQVGWGDLDGVPGVSSQGGWIGIDSLKMDHLHVWPRTDFALESPDFEGTYDKNGDGGQSDLQFLTMDLVYLPVDPADNNDGPFYFDRQSGMSGGMYVVQRTGIPTLNIVLDSMSVNVVTGPFEGNPAVNGYKPHFDQLLGKIYLSGLNVATGKDGVALIWPHSNGSNASSMFGNLLIGSGVSMELQQVKVDYLLLDKLAWGDIDGKGDIYTPGSTPEDWEKSRIAQGLDNEGWVGLKDLAIKNIIINGKTSIDVGTVLANDGSTISDINVNSKKAFLSLPAAQNEIYNTIFDRDGGKTFASITLGDHFTVSMEKLGAWVVLGKSVSDDDFVEKLGYFGASGMNLDIINNQETKAGSYVRIFAH